VGAGGSAAKAVKAHLSPSLTKTMSHQFMQTPPNVLSPTHALRTAQVCGSLPRLACARVRASADCRREQWLVVCVVVGESGRASSQLLLIVRVKEPNR
jgi:hypothetical protein